MGKSAVMCCSVWENPYRYTDALAEMHKDKNNTVTLFPCNFLNFGCIDCCLYQPLNTSGQVGVRVRQPPLFTPLCQCQHVFVFLGNHEIDFLPVGKQYCKEGNHSHSMLCLTGLWEGKNRGTCDAGSKAVCYSWWGYDSTCVHCCNLQQEITQ